VEVLSDHRDAWILTDEIEAQRLRDEELPKNFQLHVNPWADAVARESFVCRPPTVDVLSDRPTSYQDSLPRHSCITSSDDAE